MMNHYLIKQNFLIAIIFSIIFHLVFIYNFSNSKKKKTIKRYTVVNLASYKKFSSVKTKKKTEEKKPVKKKKETLVKKEIALEDKKPKKKIVKKEIVVEDKKATRKILKKEVKREEVQEKFQKEIPIEKVVKKELNNIVNNRKAVTQKANDNKILADKLLTQYLNKVSDEINLLANNIYPRQSIMRREQGKIITRIIIDSTGKILKVIEVTKRPKRLAKATKALLLKKKKLIQPPEILFRKNKSITLEVPVNYVLD